MTKHIPRFCIRVQIVIVMILTPTVQAAETSAGSTALSTMHTEVAWPDLPAPLQAKLAQARNAKAQQDATWHTRWLDKQGKPLFTNRLILSDSPYLLQHAHNPVNWYAYGAEAFAAAKAQNKPLFISLGYATCHWCHVMARESFESAAVATKLNTSFIAVKVDRQQQPELDQRYQMAVTLQNHGQTGWPASVFALPDGRPFFSALYQPEADFLATLQRIETAWRNQNNEVNKDAVKLTALVRQRTVQKEHAATLNDAVLRQAVQDVAAQFDSFQGGFGDGTKFPQAQRLLFLLDQRAHAQTHLSKAQAQSLRNELDLTLNYMARGGLFDPLGGGFFRYSTTPDWQLPHFEKMAYDQALLARTYLKAGLVLGDANYWHIAKQTLDFVIHDMTAKEGGFVAALDAESRISHAKNHANQKIEGYFYTWTPDELSKVLAPNEARLAERYWSITPEGGSGAGVDGRSVPHRGSVSAEVALAQAERLSVAELTNKMAAIRIKLQRAQRLRPPPDRDENRILAWNGLLIQALAEGGRLLKTPRFVEAAQTAATFVQKKMRLADGSMAHSYNRGMASGRANLADHANFALGLVALYDATGQKHWLDAAKEQARIIEQFFSSPEGGYFDHIKTSSEILANSDVLNLPLRPIDDGAEPAGNAQVLALVLALAERTGDAGLSASADRILASFSGLVVKNPSAFTAMLTGLSEARQGSVSNLRYTATGAVRIEAARLGAESAEVRVQYTPPWHSNAYKASAGLIPTTLSVEPAERITHIQYPSGQKVNVAFSTTPLNLYMGSVAFKMKLRSDATESTQISVQIQSCSDTTCLAPEHISIWLPPLMSR